MIARMSKYDFILYAGQSDDFIERLRELGIDHATLEFESDVQPCGEHADCDMEQGRCGGASQPVR